MDGSRRKQGSFDDAGLGATCGWGVTREEWIAWRWRRLPRANRICLIAYQRARLCLYRVGFELSFPRWWSECLNEVNLFGVDVQGDSYDHMFAGVERNQMMYLIPTLVSCSLLIKDIIHTVELTVPLSTDSKMTFGNCRTVRFGNGSDHISSSTVVFSDLASPVTTLDVAFRYSQSHGRTSR